MAKIDGPTGTAPAYNIQPSTDQTPTPPTPSPAEVTDETPDTGSAARKRLESAMEADYLRDQLNRAQYHPGVGVLYDKSYHDPAAHATETKAPAPVSVVG